MKMVDIIWCLEQRQLPGVGIVNTGEKYSVPKNMADNLIKMGHAKPPAKKTKSPKKEN